LQTLRKDATPGNGRRGARQTGFPALPAAM